MTAAMLAQAAGSIIGSGLDYLSNKSTAKANIRLQKQFAKEGIQWKVKDAEKAGIHPLYALGAQTHSFSPVSVGSDFGTAFANAGQDVSRAINATRSTDQRLDAYQSTLQKFQLERASLENEVLRADLASRLSRLAQASGPPLPSDGRVNSASDVKKHAMFGTQVQTNPNFFSDMQDIEDRYGDWVSGPLGIASLSYDVWKHNRPAPNAPRMSDKFREWYGNARNSASSGYRHWTRPHKRSPFSGGY